MIEYNVVDDEMFSLLNVAIETLSPAVIGYVPDIRWPNVTEPGKPDGSKFWLRVNVQTLGSPQSSLSTCVEEPYLKRYTSDGFLLIELYCPKSLVTSPDLGKQLAMIVRSAYRGKSTPGNIWFRNVRINEIQPEDLFYRYNVVAEFEYDEIG